MAVSEEFVDYVVDHLADWAKVSVRRMFGGAGLVFLFFILFRRKKKDKEKDQ